MEETKLKRKIEYRYAVTQSAYCSSAAILTGFSTVYLISKGLTDGTIGFASSIILIITIITPAILASFSDNHPQIPLKYIIVTLCMVSFVAAVLLSQISMAPAFLIIVYIIMNGLFRGCNSLLNALLVQFINLGIPVNYGWPRGCGSVCHALTAIVLGWLIDKYNADLALIVFAILDVMLIIAIFSFPKSPTANREKEDKIKKEDKITYFDILKGNPTLVLFIVSIALQNIGEIPSFTYLIRIVEPLGGSTTTLGVCLLIEGLIEAPMLFLSGFLLKKHKPVFWLIISSVFYVVRACTFAFAPSLGFVYFGNFINIFCNGLLCFASVLFVDSIVGEKAKVRAQAIILLGRTLGMTLGGLAISGIIDTVGFGVVKKICVAASAIGMVIMFVCYASVKKRFPELTRIVNDKKALSNT